MKVIADIHTHTVLSPCGDLEMSPAKIIQKAKDKGLDIIGITDHNSTKHAALIRKLGKEKGIFVLMGAEVTTKEEIHCLCFFENEKMLLSFEKLISSLLPDIPNDPLKFGYQVVVNEKEEILEEITPLLINALDISIEELYTEVKRRDGIFIPAHIDKTRNSIISQLGFIPSDLPIKTVELSPNYYGQLDGILNSYHTIKASDAHYIQDIGKTTTTIEIDTLSFESLKNLWM